MGENLIKEANLKPLEKDKSRDEEITRLYYEILFLDEDPYGYSLRSKYKVRNKQIISVLSEYYLNSKIKIIDLGSGIGQLMKLVGREFPLIQITCTEPSPNAVKALRKSGCFSVIQTKLPQLSGVSGLYDCATCFDAFAYMPNREARNHAATSIYRILEPEGLFIVDDWHADDLDPHLFKLEKTFRFDGETITSSFYFWIENRYRMIGHILNNSNRELFEKFDLFKRHRTTQLVLRHRTIMKIFYVLAKPIVWTNRIFIGSVTVRRLLSALQKHSYKIYIYRKVEAQSGYNNSQ